MIFEDADLDTLRAQLAKALEAEGNLGNARDLKLETQKLAQALSAWRTVIVFLRNPAPTIDDHADFISAQLLIAAQMPRSRASKADVKNRQLCVEVCRLMLEGASRDDACVIVSAGHPGEKAGLDTVKAAYYKFRQTAGLSELFHLVENIEGETMSLSRLRSILGFD